MRRAQQDQQYRTPDVITFNYEDMYSYGSEMNTMSANFRPGNSNTVLRRKLPKSSAKQQNQRKSSLKNSSDPTRRRQQETTEKSEYMDPADDSFTVSPLNQVKYDSNKKPSNDKNNNRLAAKQPTGNATISGLSEFDYLGQDEEGEEEVDGSADFMPAEAQQD